MSTRAQVRFATREDGVSFSEHPEKINAQFYVHSDGYPEGLGLEIADSLANTERICDWEIEPLTHKHGDLDYVYYIWQYPGKDTWISIFKVVFEEGPCECCTFRHNYEKIDKNCIFVGKPRDLLIKYGSQEDDSYYKQNTNDDG